MAEGGRDRAEARATQAGVCRVRTAGPRPIRFRCGAEGEGRIPIGRAGRNGARMTPPERSPNADMIFVTMTRPAAIAASDALVRAFCRMTPDMWPPTSEGDRKDFETT